MGRLLSGRKRMMSRIRLPQFAWIVLLYNLPVIVFGAYVRASFSGDGCGNHWPDCGGQVIPVAAQTKTLIEFTHRMMSGIDGLLVFTLFLWCWRFLPKANLARWASFLALLFTADEAWIGRKLVLLRLVAHNTSPARAVWMSAHLANTFLLLGSLAVTAALASGWKPVRWKGQGAVGWALAGGLIATMLLGVSGAVTALGDTLFPAAGHVAGLKASLAPQAHFLQKLRLLHPLIAMTVGLYTLLLAGLASHLRPSENTNRFARGIFLMFLLQIATGFLNYALSAPIAMQLIHLLLADLVWINLILLSVAALSRDAPHIELPQADSAPPVTHPAVTWKTYLTLTKPRVISLLLFTTLAAMVIARGGWPGTILFLAVAIGGYMAAGAANAINMVIDRDIDGLMKRTASRPTVTEQIPSRKALLFGFGLAALSFIILAVAANLLTAMLAFAGLVFYVVIYTLMLKRRTWQNIVIGGAAGSFPPLVGWAAVRGDLSVLAWLLFAIIFVWTPVHFWALALLIKDDYAAAGVPMLPVVKGDRATVIQIGAYALVTTCVSLIPMALRDAGWLYLAGAIALNAVLLQQCAQLYRRPERPQASRLFHYSMLYLALLFLVLALDRSFITPARAEPALHREMASERSQR